MPETVMIIDDNEVNRAMLRELFATAGCNAACFDHPDAALAALGEAAPSAFVVDYHLPVMDGVTFAQKAVEADARVAERTFVFFTGDTKVAENADLTFLNDAQIFLKPATLNTIKQAVLGRSHVDG
ncbi:MAG: response regulator [Pseudomonadota bacterium]